MLGEIVKLVPGKFFGFIAPDDGQRDLFFHRRSLANVDFQVLMVGERVEFEIGEDRDGRRCATVVARID